MFKVPHFFLDVAARSVFFQSFNCRIVYANPNAHGLIHKRPKIHGRLYKMSLCRARRVGWQTERMLHPAAGVSGMLLHKPALREELSSIDEKQLNVWKKLIRDKLDLPPADCLLWMRTILRKSRVFRKGFLTCGKRDLGHYAVQHAIITKNLPVLSFLMEAEIPNLYCLKLQGTLVLNTHKNNMPEHVMSNVFEEDEPYLYTAIRYGSSDTVEILLRFVKCFGVHDGYCQNTTFLSLALRQMCTCPSFHTIDALKKVCLLLKHGANPLLPDASGATSMTIYCDSVDAVRAESIHKGHLYNKTKNNEDKHKMKTMLLLLKSHIPAQFEIPFAAQRMWSTTSIINPLQIPARKGNTWLLYLLMRAGVNIDSLNDQGQNALFAGLVGTKVPGNGAILMITTPLLTLSFLIRHGINTRQTDLSAYTPITHILRHYPHSDLLHQKLEMLFEGGVDIEQASVQQHTALSLAKALAATNPSKFTSILELVQTLVLRNSAAMHQDIQRIEVASFLHDNPFHLPQNLLLDTRLKHDP